MKGISIQQQYKDFLPPVDASAVIERLLKEIPPQYVAGLATVVLRNQKVITARKRRIGFRGRKIELTDCGGLYHRQSNNGSAWIELYVDNVFPKRFPSLVLKSKLLQDLFVARVLFHELGHHIDHTLGGKEHDSEAAAEKWRMRLTRSYFTKRHYLFMLIAKPLRAILRIVGSLASQLEKRRRASEPLAPPDGPSGRR